MTNDLVKRLCEHAEQFGVSHVPNICEKAADRIETLEVALQTLTDKLYADFDGGRKLRRYDIDEARAALAGEKKDG